jgi:serine/threonine protein kinase
MAANAAVNAAVYELPPTRRASPLALASLSAADPTLPRRDLPQLFTTGTVVDKYRIDGLLGIGGTAVVYRATHVLLRTQVALKFVRSREPWAARQLVEEARCMARIKHPNIVRVHDVTHGPEATYLVMEYVEGRSLSKAIEAAGPLSPCTVTAMAIDVVEGLRAALAHGIIHRDIKPANILLSASGPARLIDFGLSYLPPREMLPITGDEIVGTQGYIAPEQLRNPRRIDFRADVYSLGVTLSRALLGIAPSRPRPEPGASERLPPLLVRLVRDMVSPSPELRPSSYELLLARLRAVQRAGDTVKHVV